ncbi:hypothetical protein [Acinetobacter sp.]
MRSYYSARQDRLTMWVSISRIICEVAGVNAREWQAIKFVSFNLSST